MFAPGAMALLATDIPLGDRLGLDVVVYGMAAIAERSGGPGRSSP